MIQWPNLPSDRSGRSQIILFIASAIAAILLGFVLVPPALAGRLIVGGGYYYVLSVFAFWIFLGWRIADSNQGDLAQRVWRGRWIIGSLVVATLFAVWTDCFAHKLLFDEYVLQGTAWYVHLTKEIGTPIRAYDFSGTWVVTDAFLDKRPYFFTFLLSLIHDLTGFRLGNVFALNVVLAFVVLSASCWMVLTLTGTVRTALFTVALLATLPLFGQNATGGSMEVLNLAMIAVLMVAATLYLRDPGGDRLSFMVLGTVLLAQSRYESVLFVIPVAVLIVFSWFRTGRVFLSWPTIVGPLLFVPYVWHDRFVSTKEHLWELRDGEKSRFALEYLSGNLKGAYLFLSNISPLQPNSLWLVLLGLGGISWALFSAWRMRRKGDLVLSSPGGAVFAVFALTILTNLGILMFYYWSRLDEPVTARFALPLFLLLSIAAGWFVHATNSRRLPTMRIAEFGLFAWLLVIAAPTYAHQLYTSRNLVMHELEWELDYYSQVRRPDFLITSKATLPFVLKKISTINTNIARLRAPQIAWHMRHGAFQDVWVSQVIRPTSADGDRAVDPEDQLPSEFHLETITEKRFGARWIRLSRLMGISSVAPEVIRDVNGVAR